MRLILFFDLPVITSAQRKEATKFVKEIKKIGFYMLQESVYLKLCLDGRAASSYVNQVDVIKPREGSVAILTITEKQFADINFLLGDGFSDVISSDERYIEL